MDNSLVSHLSRYVDALFKDIAFAYSRARELERDKNRLIHELEVHGERILTIDLPALAKHFYKCLDQGLYTRSNLRLSTMVSRRVQVPAFMRDLYLQVFDSEGKLRDEPSTDAISVIITITRTLSKAKLPCSKKALRDEALNFKSIESSLRTPSLNWEGDHLADGNIDRHVLQFSDLPRRQAGDWVQLELVPRVEPIMSRPDAAILHQVSDRIASALGDFHDESPRELPKHGPGRVSNQRAGVSKYQFDEWPTKLDAVFSYDLYARTDFGLGQDRKRDKMRVSHRETPSKLIAVPKTQAGPRLIASEPNQHQWLQGLVANQIIERYTSTVLKNCISFDNQEFNGRMALESSKSGSHATVDLKSASDCLSCWSVERFFRANHTLLERIHATRTRMIINRVDSTVWQQMVLRKCFTQGNALTFPVQSICYAIVAIASVIIANGEKVTDRTLEEASTQVRIFGDDIIIPTEALETLVRILEALQLRVNYGKTFSKGKFRESCGVDAYDGVNVTPVFVKTVSTKPRHEQAVSAIESSNNLFKAGMWNVAEWLRSTVGYKLPIVSVRSNAFGWSSFVGSSYQGLKSRYNAFTQQTEYAVFVLKDSSDKLDQPGSYKLFEYLLEKSRKPSLHPLSFLQAKKGSDRLVVGQRSSVMSRVWATQD